MNRWTKLAVSEAEKSDYVMRVGAVVYNKGCFISSGHNHAAKPISNHLPKFRKWKYSIHAEVDAITRARKDLKGSSILIIRINKHGQFRYSRPCNHCMAYLLHVGIKKIHYSIDRYPYIVSEKI